MLSRLRSKLFQPGTRRNQRPDSIAPRQHSRWAMTILCREGARMVSGNGRQKCHARNEGQRSREISQRRNRRCSHTSSLRSFLSVRSFRFKSSAAGRLGQRPIVTHGYFTFSTSDRNVFGTEFPVITLKQEAISYTVEFTQRALDGLS